MLDRVVRKMLLSSWVRALCCSSSVCCLVMYSWILSSFWSSSVISWRSVPWRSRIWLTSRGCAGQGSPGGSGILRFCVSAFILDLVRVGGVGCIL